MKKINKLLIFVIMIFSMCFVSCQQEQEENKEHQVIFNLMGGVYNESEESVVIKTNDLGFVTPVVPTKTGYKFLGWSSNLNQSMINDVDFTVPLKESKVVYAVWSLPQISYELNGGYFTKYNSFDELVEDLVNDFTTIREWINKYWFFDDTYNTINEFFQNKAFFEKWKPLLEYLKVVSLDSTCNRQINNILDGKYSSDESYAELRMNIHNLINRYSKHPDQRYSYLTTIDYSNDEVIDKIWDYFKINTPSYYDSSSDYVLKTPRALGKTFVGWYDNPEFTGEKITVIPAGTITDLKYYALWA